ncbi:MAG: hypothetical protein KGL92_07435 [Gammaproteobacteria bacterium]|nr:hypothetical protein [Gammaproteobacteria bacterium]
MISVAEGAQRDGHGPPSRRPPGSIATLPFAACFVYSPTGAGSASCRSRRLCAAIKANDSASIGRAAALVGRLAARDPMLAAHFGARPVLVPVPPSAPGSQRSPWAAARIAAALADAGLGADVRPLIARRLAVQKSATAAAGARPSVRQHYDSFGLIDACADACAAPPAMLLIDDVITRGRTLFAAACFLRATFPDARIGAFALVRTMGFGAGVARILDPCVGEIRWRRDDAYREP